MASSSVILEQFTKYAELPNVATLVSCLSLTDWLATATGALDLVGLPAPSANVQRASSKLKAEIRNKREYVTEETLGKYICP